jgi:hypothetical protein
MTVGDSDISLFPSSCFRFLFPTFALFVSFLFSLSRLSFPSLASFARSNPFRILFPGFSLSLPVFAASAPRFFGFRPYFFGIHPYFCRLLSPFHCSKNTFRQSGGRSRTELPDSTPFSA